MASTNNPIGSPAKRILIATQKANVKETVVLEDELPPLQDGEIRMSVDKVGLSTNNLFYAQMGNAPFLKFFAVYPLPSHEDLVVVPAWGMATITESKNAEFSAGEKFRGFLHMTNVVQMKAKRSEDGFIAYGGNRDKLNSAYNGFIQVNDAPSSPFKGEGAKSDLAMTAAPGALSGYILYELLKMNDMYKGDRIVFTSASSKLSLAIAVLLKEERAKGRVKVIGYTGDANKSFIESTGYFDEVLTYDQPLPSGNGKKHVMVDVAGDARILKQNKKSIIKALAVGGTHSNAKSSTFTAFGPSGIVKMILGMASPNGFGGKIANKLNPTLEMFFAPTVMSELKSRWGKETFDQKCEEALGTFVNAAIDNKWIEVNRLEDLDGIQASYKRIFTGKLPPSEAIILSMAKMGMPAGEKDYAEGNAQTVEETS